MKRLFLMFLAISLTISLVACENSIVTTKSSEVRSTSVATKAPDTTKASSGASNGKLSPREQLYVFVSAFNSTEYELDHKKGWDVACKALGVRGEFFGPADANADEQIAAFEQAIAMNPQGIIVHPVSNEIDAITAKAMKAGIPVAYVDSDYSSFPVTVSATGNFNAGVIGGKYLVDILGGKGKVAILYRPENSSLVSRVSGYESVFAKYPNIKVVAKADTKADYQVSAQVATAILQSNPDLDAFVCVEATGGSGAATALKESGSKNKVKILAMDKESEVIQLIGEGVITATVTQNTQLMSYYGLQVLYSMYNNSNELGYTKEMGVNPAPYIIDTGCYIIDASNYKNFLRNK